MAEADGIDSNTFLISEIRASKSCAPGHPFSESVIVRWRFPEIPVIAFSGAFASGDCVPGGVMADAFHPKGRCRPDELFSTVTDLIRTSTGKQL